MQFCPAPEVLLLCFVTVGPSHYAACADESAVDQIKDVAESYSLALPQHATPPSLAAWAFTCAC